METRNKRRICERVQFGGWMEGGATSCDQSDRERSVKKGVVCGSKVDASGMSDAGGKSPLT